MIAAIPYTTFPEIHVGPLTLRVFGLMVAAGVLVGARLGGSYGERFGVLREDSYRTGTLMVLAGIIGSRLTWVATHTDTIKNPVDVIVIWQGGIQFSGGFIAALAVGYPMFRKWSKAQRWNVLNGYAWGLTVGIVLGRVGCYSVGEHFGRQSDFFLATRYDGGSVRESTLGGVQLIKGVTTFHNTALYEMITLGLLFVVMTGMILLARRKGTEVKPGTLVALFMVYGGIERFLLDTLRVNDERFLHMTGAQWMSLVMVPYGIWVWIKVRPEVSQLVGPDGLPLDLPDPDEGSILSWTGDETDADEPPAPDELAPPEDAESDSDSDDSDSEDSEESDDDAGDDEDSDDESSDEASNGTDEKAPETVESGSEPA